MKKLAILSVVVAVLTCAGHAQTDNSDQPASNSQQRHQKYIEVNRQILARRADPGSGALNQSKDKFDLASLRLHDMIVEEIKIALAVPKPSASSITAAISKLQGELALSSWDPNTNVPFAELFSLNGNQTLAVAYVIMQGGGAIPDTQAYLEFYDKSSGIWKRRASAPTKSDFKYSTFYVSQLNSGVPGEAWFLAWGVPIGSSRGSHYVWLYCFDGSTVKTIWKRGPLRYGKVAVTPDSVTLEYEDESNATGTAREVLHVTPNGLE